MKKLLLSSVLLVSYSMFGMEQEVKVKLRLADAKEDLTPLMKMGLKVYSEMIDKADISEEEKTNMKMQIGHSIGYIQAMANIGHCDWPLIIIEDKKDNSQIGFSSCEYLNSEFSKVAIHTTPLSNPKLLPVVAPQVIKFIKKKLLSDVSDCAIFTALAKGKASASLLPVIEELGFEQCADYKLDSQYFLDPQEVNTYKKEFGYIGLILRELLDIKNSDSDSDNE